MEPHATAVYFADAEYASGLRRFISFVIDFAAYIFLLTLVLSAIQYPLVPENVRKMPRSAEQRRLMDEALRPYRTQMWIAAGITTLAYYVLLRTTRHGAIGNRLTATRVVDETGEAPRLRIAGRRFLLAASTCWVFGVTYFFCRAHARGQTFHDRYAGTWVVRRDSRPAGRAIVQYQLQMLGPWLLKYVSLAPAD
ncbi:MAG TPA: RDD family protein, partial [Phycisphaerae bacterium]|nr:RDD family protein [Phycisphaerae bacterium]